METYRKKLQLRWSDLDPINHVRHSVYYDFAAQLRTDLFRESGIRLSEMAQAGFGPVLFEEKATFRRELRYEDELYMTAEIAALKRDYGRFAFKHEIWREDQLCATVEILGAWIDLRKRKLTVPPSEFLRKLENLPRAKDFQWLD